VSQDSGDVAHRVDPVTMRRMNAARVLRVLHARDAMTLTDLGEATGLARRTTELAAEGLVRRRLVIEIDPPATARPVGRPARRFAFRSDAGRVLGLSIGVREIVAMVTDLQARSTWESRSSISRGADRAQRIDTALTTVDACLDEASTRRDELWGAAVATPGLVVESRRVTLCQVMPDWSDIDLANIIGEALLCPVRVVNDTNAAAVAERWRGVARGVDDMVWVLTGRHSRAALLIGGELVVGADGAAGEIGWLSELGWEHLADHPLSFVGTDTLASSRAEELLTDVEAATPPALRAVKDYARGIAPGLSALALVLNPELMVLGGVAARIGSPLLESVRQQVEARALRSPNLQLSALDDSAIPLGAVRLALDLAEDRLFRFDGVVAGHERGTDRVDLTGAARR
jgi:predicted NBD/HSP70 family sugar kinase